MSTIVKLEPLSAESARSFLVDSAAFVRYFQAADDALSFWCNDRNIVDEFAAHPAVRQTIFRRGQPVVLPAKHEWGRADFRILLPPQVEEFNALLSAIDEAAMAALCARLDAEARAQWAELGISFGSDDTEPYPSVFAELKQFVGEAAAQAQALLIYWGH